MDKIEKAKELFKSMNDSAQMFVESMDHLFKHLSSLTESELSQLENECSEVNRLDEIMTILEKSMDN